MINKLADSVAQALQGVKDGATVLIGGFGTAGIPGELIDGLIAQGARDLTVVNNNAGNADYGVAALLKAYPAAFATVQWVGAAYLAWMGYKLITAKPGQGAVLQLKPSHFARQSFFITLLNPKAIVFYMAFFPLFIDPARAPGLGTFAAMALTIAVLTFAYGLAATLISHFMAERIRANPRVSGGLQKLAGVALIGFGLRLALTK